MVLLRNMIARFSRRDRIAAQIYGDCVAVTRDPAHYCGGRVADSVDGRFDILAMHLFLVIHRLRAAGSDGQAMVQSVIDSFVRDMDQNLREMGAGDVGVARNVKHMAEALNGLLRGYERALAEGPGALADYAGRNVILRTDDDEAAELTADQQTAAQRLAGYVQAQIAFLSTVPDDECLAGRCRMRPAAVAYGEDAVAYGEDEGSAEG